MKTATLHNMATRQSLTRRTPGKHFARKFTIRKILVPVDFFEPSLVAIGYASKVATRLGAELNLVHVVEPLPPFLGTEENLLFLSDSEAGIRARKHLRNAAEVNEIPLRPEHIHVVEGRPFEEIYRLARKLDIDLIVIPTRGKTGFKHLAFGSTAESVVRHSPCPVLVLHAKSKPRLTRRLPAASPSFRRIIAPIDFSDCSMTGLAYAKNLAREFRSTLVLLHSVHLQYYVTNDEYARYDLPMVLSELERAGRKQMRDLVKETDWHGLKIESSVEIGHPGQQICDRAKDRQADLIVTATHGRTGLAHAFIGSTAEFVVRYAHCPVLVVPTRAK